MTHFMVRSRFGFGRDVAVLCIPHALCASYLPSVLSAPLWCNTRMVPAAALTVYSREMDLDAGMTVANASDVLVEWSSTVIEAKGGIEITESCKQGEDSHGG